MLECAAGNRIEHRQYMADAFKFHRFLVFVGRSRSTISFVKQLFHALFVLQRKIELKKIAKFFGSQRRSDA